MVTPAPPRNMHTAILLLLASFLLAALASAIEPRVLSTTTVTSDECNAASNGCSSYLSSMASNSEGLLLSLGSGGVYNLTSSVVVTNASGLVIDGGGIAVLSGHGLVAPLQFYDVQGLELREMTITAERMPFTVGVVESVAADGASVTVSVDLNAYPFPSGEEWGYLYAAESLLGYDASTRTFAAPDLYLTGDAAVPLSVDFENSRVTIDTSSVASEVLDAILPQSSLIVRHYVYAYNGIYVDRCNDVAISSVTIETAPGMGIVARRVHNLLLDTVRVAPSPASGHPMSTTADAMHFGLTSGAVTVRGGTFEAQGDDGLNMQNDFHQINDGACAGATTLSLTGRLGSLPDVIVGDVLEFRDRQTLQVLGSRGVVATREDDDGDQMLSVTLDAPSPEDCQQYDVTTVANVAPESVAVHNNAFLRNRARGAIFRVGNVRCFDNVFNATTGPAVFVKCDDAYWLESSVSANVTIGPGNTVDNVNYGIASDVADVWITAIVPDGWTDHSVPPPMTFQELQSGTVHNQISITGNLFLGSWINNAQGRHVPTVSVRAVDTLEITGNTLERQPGSDATAGDIILGSNNENVDVTGNSCTGGEGDAGCVVVQE